MPKSVTYVSGMFCNLCLRMDILNQRKFLMSKKFSASTFKYFASAKKNTKNKDWFLKNKELYQKDVHEPFENLILEIKKKLQSELPDLRIDSKLITRPTRPANKAQEPHLANLHR
jgi:uncharacterized protein (DUF2461 family)